MKSNLKTILTKEQIEHLTAIHFPGIKIIDMKESPDGNIGSVYILHVVSEKNAESDLVLKVGMRRDADCLRYEKELFPTELMVYPLLKDKKIPMPRVLEEDLSCSIVPAGYFFMDFVEGRTWVRAAKELDTEEKRRLMRKLGEYSAQISSVKGAYFGYLKDGEQHHFTTHSEAFCSMMRDILLDGKEHGFDLPYEKVRALMEKYRCLLDEVKEPRLVDFDMWAGNVFVNKKKTVQISGIIDFGHCFYGDLYAAFPSAVHLLDDVEKETEFIKGYESVSGRKLCFTEKDRIRMDLYRLYMALLCAVETYRYEEPIAAKQRTSQLKRIDGLIKKLL